METNKVLLWLDNATTFLEQAITRLSILCLITGFIMGTVSILTPQFQLASLNWYNLVWAIVQAVSMDTLFVGVLFTLRDTWESSKWGKKLWFIGVAVLLGVVAAMINVTLAYQELAQIGSKQVITTIDSMGKLGINIVIFAYVRSILVVIVTSLVCTLPRKKIEHKRPSNRDRLLQKYRRSNENREAYLIAQSERVALEEKYAQVVQAPQPVKWSLFGIFVVYDTTVQTDVKLLSQEASSITAMEELSEEERDTDKVHAVGNVLVTQMTTEEEIALFGKK